MAASRAVFTAAADSRERRGQRNDLPFALTCLVAALLGECGSLAVVYLWQAAEGECTLLDDANITM
jgi:hypothetical protein